jgi:4-hydroxy-2-oxoheptanedioate aldolase
VWATLGEPRTSAELEHSGLDWVVLDCQHGHFDDQAVRASLSLRRERVVPVLVRVRSNDAGLIGRALDAGADGVVVPLVESAEAAEAAVAAAHYPPRGMRSWGPLPGLERTDGENGAPPRPLVMVMVETARGLEQVERIAATPDLALLLVGPNDLALSLGTDVDAMIADDRPGAPLPRIVRAAREAGVVPAAFGATVERAAGMAGLGFEWVVAALDIDLLAEGGAIGKRVRDRLS